MGGILLALSAGRSEAKIPTAVAARRMLPKTRIRVSHGTWRIVRKLPEFVLSRAATPAIPTPQPSRMPMLPPRREIRTASVINRSLISLRWAPVARRTPSSRVRSRTLMVMVLASPDRANQ